MKCLVSLVILAVVATASSAHNLTVASATDEYVELWNRKYQTDIISADMKIECVDGRGADSIRVIKDQHEEILKEIIRYRDRLVPAQALSLIRKHCIQIYKPMLISYDSAYKQLMSCTAVAQSRVSSLTVAAKNTVSAAKASANVNLPKALRNCNNSKPAKRETCIVSNVESYTSAIQANMRTIDKNLDRSLCSSTDLTRDAIQCSFSIQRNILVTIGKVASLIDICIKGKETACPCSSNLLVESRTTNVVQFLTGKTTTPPTTTPSTTTTTRPWSTTPSTTTPSTTTTTRPSTNTTSTTMRSTTTA